MKQIFYNNHSDRNLTKEFLRQIRNANQWIKACNLLFDDPDISKELLSALQRDVALFILTNLDGVSGEVYTSKSTGKKQPTKQSIQNVFHSESLKKLYQAGAHISGLDGLHAKFLLTETGEGMITSLNFTSNSVDKISEIGVQLSGKVFDEAEEVFDHLFLRPDKCQFASHESHFSYERPSEAIDCEQLSGLSNLKLTLGPTERGEGAALAKCDIRNLRDEIFDIISSTESGEDLYIATYSFDPKATDSDGKTLEEVLLNAKNRGVKLYIVVRDEKRQFIKGIFTHCHVDNHAKVVMNGNRGILFTGNLTEESFEKGFDIGVILSPEQICEAKKFINLLIEQTKR